MIEEEIGEFRIKYPKKLGILLDLREIHQKHQIQM